MGRILRGFKTVLLIVVCALLLTSIGVHKTYASQETAQPRDEGTTGKAKAIYTLTYPYGPSETVYSLEEAENKTKEWKLLYKDTTDENGQIILEDWITKGEIKIVEIEAPDGYEIIEKEKVVPLEDGEVTFVNKKEDPKPEIKKEEPKPETPRPVPIPKTGIDSLTPYKSQQQHPTPQEPEEPTEKKADFIINKVDQEKKPLKGAEFEVYGKPTYEVEFEIRITKNYDGIHPVLPLKGLKTNSETPDTDINKPENADENQDVPTEEPCFLMANEPTRNGLLGDGNASQSSTYEAYIEDTITVVIISEGDDNNAKIETITPENKTVTFRLKSGTYTIYEHSTLIWKPAESEDKREQSYLNPYIFNIDEEGNITRVSGSKWYWLKAINGEYRPGSCSQGHDDKVGVKLEGDTITISNFAFIFDETKPCPPK